MSTKFYGNTYYKVLNQEIKAATKYNVRYLGWGAHNAPCFLMLVQRANTIISVSIVKCIH
jgi:hypothetical protein